MKQFVTIIISMLLLFSACTDKYSEEMPSPGEFTTISLDGVIADRNDDFTKSLNPAATEQQGGIAFEMARTNDPEAISTKANPTSFFVRYMLFNDPGNNIYTSSVRQVTPVDSKFSLQMEIPNNTGGDVFVFMTYRENELPTADKIRTKTDLQNYWSAYTLLSKDDIIPIVGSVNIPQGSQRVSMTLKHIGCKLNLKYTIGSSSDFKIDSVCIGNVTGRNYFVNLIQQTTNTTGRKRYASIATMQQDDLTFFIPENMQGVKAISKPSDKNKKNAPAKATYIELIGKKISTNQTARIRIYPGANNTTDFNLMRNGYYRVSLGIYYLDPNDDRITIGTESPTLIFDITPPSYLYGFSSYFYNNDWIFHNCTYEINGSRIIVNSKAENIGKKIRLIYINDKKIDCSIPIKAGTNYYTLDWSYNGTGAGTEDDPYQVATKNNLNDVRNHLNSHFLQVENIDLGIGWGNFNSISNSTKPFKGVYDGNKLSIGTLFSTNQIANCIFGYLNNAEIKNICLNVQSTYSYEYQNTVGYIASNATQSIISDCEISGSITNSGMNSNIGSILGIGYNCKLLRNKFNGVLTISGSNNYGGGIIGYAYKCQIENNTIGNTASITTGTGNRTGAMAGISEGSIFINNIFDRQKYPKEAGLVQP